MTTDLQPKLNFTPAENQTIEDLDTLRVMADPLRLKIRELMYESCTVKQVAAALSIPATKLYYHINLLEKHGLIVLVDTRIVSGIIEKHYQVAARTISVARHLLSPADADNDGLTLTLHTIFDDVTEDVRASMQDGAIDLGDEAPVHRSLILSSERLALTAEQAEEFYRRMQALRDEFSQLSERQLGLEGIQLYKYIHALFPTSRKHRP